MRILAALWVVARALLSFPWGSASAMAHWHRVLMPRLGAGQVSTSRHPDSNDVILNVTGTLTGATLVAFLRARRPDQQAPELPD